MSSVLICEDHRGVELHNGGAFLRFKVASATESLAKDTMDICKWERVLVQITYTVETLLVK